MRQLPQLQWCIKPISMCSAHEKLVGSLSTHKHSSDNHDRSVKDGHHSVDFLYSYASLLAGAGKMKECFDVLCHTYKLSTSNFDKIYPCVSKLVDNLRQEAKENLPTPERNVYSCPSCYGVLVDPITLPCGHTFCKRCIMKDNPKICKVCAFKRKKYRSIEESPNVLVSTLVDRWWSDEVEGVKLRNRGNESFKNGRLEAAVEKYTEAVEIAPCDHLLLSNRSLVLHSLGRTEEALADADAAIRVRPHWAKGYFRRAMALVSLGRMEEALVSLILCSVLEESSNTRSIKEEIAKLLHRICTRNVLGRRSSVDTFPGWQSACSCPSTPPLSDSEDEAKNCHQQLQHKGNICCEHKWISANMTTVEEVPLLKKVVDRYKMEMDKLRKGKVGYVRKVDSDNLEKTDFECTLCFRYLWQPVTTPCGHSFCRMCLDRCLDHSTNCPLCKTSLKDYLAERRGAIAEFVEVAMQTLMPEEYAERHILHEEEMDELADAGKDAQHDIPIFVATLAIPTITCPLHVFEPRYRLMIRRCMESGTREFGMCLPLDSEENGYANYGTMLEIRDVQYASDGRSIVNTVGSRRFKIARKSIKDGYNTAAVEFLQDEVVQGIEVQEVQQLHNKVHVQAAQWFDSVEMITKRRILSHYGAMPAVEGDYWTLHNGPAWIWWVVAILPLDPRIQLSVLRETCLQRRLDMIGKILRVIRRQNSVRQ